MPRTTEEDLIWARSGKRPINIVRWGPYEIIPEPYGGGRLVSSKEKGHKLMGIWKRWYERKGWRVVGNYEYGYRAYPPEWEPGSRFEPHGCQIRTYRLENEEWVRDWAWKKVDPVPV